MKRISERVDWREGLTPQQVTACDLLARGDSIEKVAEFLALPVDRVRRWERTNVRFQVALRLRRRLSPAAASIDALKSLLGL